MLATKKEGTAFSFLATPFCATIMRGLPQAPDGFAEAVIHLGNQINSNCEGRGAIRLVPVANSSLVCLVANKYLAKQFVPVSISGAATKILIDVGGTPYRLGEGYIVPWKPSDKKMQWFALTPGSVASFYYSALLIAGQDDPSLTTPAPSALELEKMAAVLGTSVKEVRRTLKTHWWNRRPSDARVADELRESASAFVCGYTGEGNDSLETLLKLPFNQWIWANWRGEDLWTVMELMRAELWGKLMEGCLPESASGLLAA